ncbi:MAG: DNA repair protein RecN [Firmicutes bacterium]|nr:DNA repair protein RecN [Bacillota bacterium]
MITHLSIRDFAIIEQLGLDFHQGLHIITGETGAGKSILIEAISLALGSRADTSYVRSGCQKAVIRLSAETNDPEVDKLLEENGIPLESPLTILREIHASGKSQCKVNGENVPVSFLNKLCRRIADIHGQFDNQFLLDPQSHILLLDRFGDQRLLEVKELVFSLFADFTEARAQLSQLRRKQAETERKRDFMAFELQEIREAAPLVGEDDALEEELTLLKNSENIHQHLSAAYEALRGDGSGLDMVASAMGDLQQIGDLSANFKDVSENISEIYYRLEDLTHEIRSLRESTEASPERLDEVILRLDILDKLKRKYGGSLEKVLAYQEEIEKDLALIEDSSRLMEELEIRERTCREQLDLACTRLTALRKEAALKLEESIGKELVELDFKEAKLQVTFDEDAGEFTENGRDKVEFLISTNRGEPLKPLAKIASGGEISRIMLAFKGVTASGDGIPTIIFDEVDTGISGATASIVGKKLRQLGSKLQVIAITHLPQVAACGDHHYRIEKQVGEERTHTVVTPLDHEESVRELARLLGGVEVTAASLENAKELMDQARKNL